MNNLQALLITVALYCMGAQAVAVDVLAFEGTCRNATLGGDGFIKMIVSDADGKLSGVMSINGWLAGGGIVQGSREGTSLHLVSEDKALDSKIDWHGIVTDSVVSGEYIVHQTASTPRQVGEWKAILKARQKQGAAHDEELTKLALKLMVEDRLNAPVKLTDGKLISGAHNIFRAVHPAGVGISVCVEDMEIDWKGEGRPKSLDEIYKFRATYVLYWQGIIRPTGWTRLRLSYNTKIDAVTSHEILQSTGTTNEEFGEIAFGIGALLGSAAMDSLLGSK